MTNTFDSIDSYIVFMQRRVYTHGGCVFNVYRAIRLRAFIPTSDVQYGSSVATREMNYSVLYSVYTPPNKYNSESTPKDFLFFFFSCYCLVRRYWLHSTLVNVQRANIRGACGSNAVGGSI